MSLRLSIPLLSWRPQLIYKWCEKPDNIDREFMPELLALIETPPSPISISLLFTIAGLFSSALIWSYFGWIDIQAIAHGKIQPIGRTKLVQPREAGMIKSVLVQNGSHIIKGEILVELDATQILSERDKTQSDLISAEAECLRREAAIKSIRDHGNSVVPEKILWPEIINNDRIREREQAALTSNLEQLISSQEVLRREIDEKKSSLARLQLQIEAQERVLEPLKERMDMRQVLYSRGTGSRLDFINAQHDYAVQNVSLISSKGQVKEIESDINLLAQKIIQSSAEFKSNNAEKYTSVAQNAADLKEVLINLNDRLSHTKISAPVSGIVQELIITTPGQVVSSGQQLMSIVPDKSELEVEAAVINSDIGFVSAGQSAIIKIDAFPFTRYGTLSGKVQQVSTDAIASQEAGMRPSPSAGGSSITSTGSQPVGNLQNLVFPITVTLDQSYMKIDGSHVQLTSGMQVTVEIQTGRRRVIEYLLSPFIEVGSTALRER